MAAIAADIGGVEQTGTAEKAGEKGRAMRAGPKSGSTVSRQAQARPTEALLEKRRIYAKRARADAVLIAKSISNASLNHLVFTYKIGLEFPF